MEILFLGIIIGLLLKPSSNNHGCIGGVKSVPPANYNVDMKVPKQPKVGD